MRKVFCLLPLSAALLTGCVSLAPSYDQPVAPVAATWPQDAATMNATLLVDGLQQWDQFFTDERLRTLISMGLQNNRNLRSAFYAVEQARELYSVSRAELFPSVSAVAQEQAQGAQRLASASGVDQTTHQYSATAAMATYELDLFGRVRNMNEQALQAYFQTEGAQRTAQMTVITEIALTWLNLGAAKDQLRLATDTYNSQLESLKLIEDSYRLGAASQLEVQQAMQTVATARVAMATATRNVSQVRSALTLLVGTSIPESLEPSKLEYSVNGKVSVASNVPSEALLARPDIAMAEAALRSANANIGVARAAFFPSISLTTSIGTQSSDLSDLFSSGTRVWSFVPNITLPIFRGGANVANLRAAEAQQKAAIADYEYVIQSAFREVSDALATEGTTNEALMATQQLADATAESLRLSMERFKNGADSYLNVLDSQRANFSAQQSLIAASLDRASSSITLYKVLGGGSQLSTETERAAKAKESGSADPVQVQTDAQLRAVSATQESTQQ